MEALFIILLASTLVGACIIALIGECIGDAPVPDAPYMAWGAAIQVCCIFTAIIIDRLSLVDSVVCFMTMTCLFGGGLFCLGSLSVSRAMLCHGFDFIVLLILLEACIVSFFVQTMMVRLF